MASKFTRITDNQSSEKIAQHLGFIEKPVEEYDPFNYLKESAEQRRASIMREVEKSGASRQKRVITEEQWRESNKPSVYAHKGISRIGENNESEFDNNYANASNITRASYETDVDESVRDIRFSDNFSDPSIFDPYVKEAAESLLSESIQKSNFETTPSLMQNTAERLRNTRESNHKSWENEKISQVKSSRVVTSRANSVMKSGEYYGAGNSFNLPDVDSINNREAQRKLVQAKKALQSKSIKRNNYTEEEKRQQWEDNVYLGQSSYNNYKSSWLDEFSDNDQY